jgi:hypothetical protein
VSAEAAGVAAAAEAAREIVAVVPELALAVPEVATVAEVAAAGLEVE